MYPRREAPPEPPEDVPPPGGTPWALGCLLGLLNVIALGWVFLGTLYAVALAVALALHTAAWLVGA